MLYLSSVYPVLNFEDLYKSSECVNAVKSAYTSSYDTAFRLLDIIISCPNLIVYSAFIRRKDLYKKDTETLRVEGFAVPDTILNLKKLGDEFMIVDDIIVDSSKIIFRLQPISNTCLVDTGIPILRKAIIDNLLKEL